jgi:hypothetical protein
MRCILLTKASQNAVCSWYKVEQERQESTTGGIDKYAHEVSRHVFTCSTTIRICRPILVNQ